MKKTVIYILYIKVANDFLGKLLNVREATHKQILENAEINNLIKILGLQYKKKYETPEDMKTLRYGKLMIMTDQDQVCMNLKTVFIGLLPSRSLHMIENSSNS